MLMRIVVLNQDYYWKSWILWVVGSDDVSVVDFGAEIGRQAWAEVFTEACGDGGV